MIATLRAGLIVLIAALVPAVLPAAADEPISVMQLMAPSPLEEMTLGDPEAPVTMIEYASLTCSHCGNFYRTVFDTLKTDYIDTGKVYFILREFPLDRLALAAVMAARCAPRDKFFPIVDALFREQDAWAFVDQPGPALMKKLNENGLDMQAVDACLGRKELAEKVQVVQKRGQEFGVTGTPAFFINGVKHPGEMDVAKLRSILDPLLETASE